ncbi:hypothetical protein E1B28_009283 [Marasmius oreades]|uniref:Uncharacterized protein n=1 Tax=Marasmius oreades TaxID=181124 RepID=A0A9P7S078_9AGAR|nr:uncharacterized protein E1B28_009283 [Marasmius oreades]KAG7092984.1 hypothetical protein E1B28_009283 [Marasmius oreades]
MFYMHHGDSSPWRAGIKEMKWDANIHPLPLQPPSNQFSLSPCSPNTTLFTILHENMQSKSPMFAGVLVTIISAFVSNATPIIQRDVYVPHITSPNTSTIWTVGSMVNVTWDTSDAPTQIGNRASVQLNEGADFSNLGKLAQDFDLRAGFVEVKVPNVDPASEYSITLFGDSGNRSPLFSIVAPETGKTKRSPNLARDVWDPRITSPIAGTVWVTGMTVNITWSVTGSPFSPHFHP